MSLWYFNVLQLVSTFWKLETPFYLIGSIKQKRRLVFRVDEGLPLSPKIRDSRHISEITAVTLTVKS